MMTKEQAKKWVLTCIGNYIELRELGLDKESEVEYLKINSLLDKLAEQAEQRGYERGSGDIEWIEKQVSRVYERFTSLSKVNYESDFIIREIEDKTYDKGITQDDVREMLDIDTLTGLKQELRRYFQLND